MLGLQKHIYKDSCGSLRFFAAKSETFAEQRAINEDLGELGIICYVQFLLAIFQSFIKIEFSILF